MFHTLLVLVQLVSVLLAFVLLTLVDAVVVRLWVLRTNWRELPPSSLVARSPSILTNQFFRAPASAAGGRYPTSQPLRFHP